MGYYACMGYFQSLKNPVNERFVKAFKDKYGQDRVIGDPMECAYNSVHFWKLGVEKAKSFDPVKVAAAFRRHRDPGARRHCAHPRHQPSRLEEGSCRQGTCRRSV